MEIQLISHASVIVRSDVSILSDPWFFGKAFNDSWSLFPPPAVDESLLDSVDFLYISHEHPDHFHIPTLKSLSDEFKSRVTILFQENNSDKVFKALNRLGFPNTRSLPHDKIEPLSDSTQIYCYQAGSMDSALGVVNSGKTVLNLNDCEINKRDCGRILSSLGRIDAVLNQFSIAGYSGFQERDKYLPVQAENVLRKMLANHVDLRAGVTIPFASFIYFSSEDNRYINDFSNKPQDAFDYFAEHGQKMAVLFPGDNHVVGSDHDPVPALERFRSVYADETLLEFDTSSTVSLPEIAAAFEKLSVHLRERYPKLMLRMLKPVTVRIPDLDTAVTFSIPDGTFDEDPNAEADLVIKSQPLYFGFSFPFGIQTLGVSARYTLIKNFPNWRRHRILFSLNNAELYLKPRLFFTSKNLTFFRKRLPGAINQFAYRLKVMR